MAVTGEEPDHSLRRLRAERADRDQFEAARPSTAGRLSPRQRLQMLIDANSFVELGSLTRSQLREAPLAPADGLVAGWARVAGREVGVLAEDPLAMSLTDGQVANNKRYRVLNTCATRRVPLVYLADAPDDGPRTGAEARGELFGFTSRQLREPVLGGLPAPSVAVVFGRCAGGGGGELVASCDAVLGVAGRPSPVPRHADLATEADALAATRRLLATLPADGRSPLTRMEPLAPEAPYANDMPVHASLDHAVNGLVDAGTAVTLAYLPSTRTAVAALDGWPVVLAVSAGEAPALLGPEDVYAVGDAARLARRARVPLLLVQDCDGYDPAADESDLLRALRGTLDELRFTFTPKLGLVLGHGHVLGTWVMGGRRLGMDFIAALPSSQVSSLDVPSYRPGAVAQEGSGPWLAAGLGHIDEVVTPEEARQLLSSMLSLTARARTVPAPEEERAGRYVDDIAKV